MHMDSTADDTYIGTLITAARMRIEEYIGRALITQTITAAWDQLPDEYEIELPRAVGSTTVTSVKVYADDDSSTTISSSNYHVSTYDEPARVALLQNVSWDSGVSTLRTVNALVAVYSTGYGASGTSVPGPILAAIKETVRAWYDADVDELADADLPPVARAMLSGYRIRNL